MHRCIFTDKTLAESTFILEKQVALAVVVQHALSQVEKSTQLAQSIAVSFHLPRVMCNSEKDAASVSRDITPLVDDMEKTTTYDLENKNKTKYLYNLKMLILNNLSKLEGFIKHYYKQMRLVLLSGNTNIQIA